MVKYIYIYIMYIYYTPMVEGQNKQNQHVETLKFRQASSGFRLNRPLIVTCWKVMAYIYIDRERSDPHHAQSGSGR